MTRMNSRREQLRDQAIAMIESASAEAAILGALILDTTCIDRVSKSLNCDEFYSDQNRMIYSKIIDLYTRGMGVDLVILKDSLNAEIKLGEIDVRYLTDLCQTTPTSANVDCYLRIVKRDAEKRRKLKTLESAKQALNNGYSDEDLKNAEQELIRTFSSSGTNYSTPAPKWLTASEFLKKECEQVRWLWNGYIARGLLTLLSARPKIGKTTLVFHLFKSLLNLNRQDFLGRSTELASKILLLTEEGNFLLKRRLERFEISGENFLLGPRFAIKNWFDTLEQIRLAITQGVTMVVIDTLASFWGIGDENDAPSVVEALLPLQTIVQQHEVAVVIIHHLRKTSGDEGTAHRGSSALLGAVDIAIEMNRDPNKTTRRVLTALSRFEETPQKMVIELEEGAYQSLGSPDEVDRLEVRGQVLASLPGPNEDPIERRELLEQLEPKPSETLLKGILTSLLEERKFVERLGTGKKGDPYRYRLGANADSVT